MEPEEITIHEVRERLERGEEIVILDVRSKKEWEESPSKIPGALRTPVTEVERLLESIPQDRTVVAYCTCRHTKLSHRVAQMLREKGFANAFHLYGGFDAWVSAQYPLEDRGQQHEERKADQA